MWPRMDADGFGSKLPKQRQRPAGKGMPALQNGGGAEALRCAQADDLKGRQSDDC